MQAFCQTICEIVKVSLLQENWDTLYIYSVNISTAFYFVSKSETSKLVKFFGFVIFPWLFWRKIYLVSSPKIHQKKQLSKPITITVMVEFWKVNNSILCNGCEGSKVTEREGISLYCQPDGVYPEGDKTLKCPRVKCLTARKVSCICHFLYRIERKRKTLIKRFSLCGSRRYEKNITSANCNVLSHFVLRV